MNSPKSIHRFGPFIIGFGKKDETPESLYPGAQWANIEQYHSDVVVPARPDFAAKADAHFTDQQGLGLIIKTADCLPVMIATPYAIAAIHAGWRGIASDIIGSTLARLKSEFPKIQMRDIRAWVGPHIRQEHFEVGADVGGTLLSAATKAGAKLADIQKVSVGRSGSEKKWIDLETIARLQLIKGGVPTLRLNFVGGDTYGDLSYASFRRDGAASGRNLSFILRMKGS